MSSEKYHYEPGAIHNDNHQEINIGSVSEKALGDILKRFFKDDAEDAEYEEVEEKKTPTSKEPVADVQPSPVVQETFADRVKAIVRKAATKNGQRIETSARGNAGAYIYNIDAEAFCKAMDVCSFIGNVIRMHVINDVNLQTVDLLFAFEGYYDNQQTVQAKLGDRKTSSEQNVVLGTFEGLLRKYKA